MIRQIAALTFIFLCTTVAWVILGGTIVERTGSRSQQLQGHVASTWGTSQEQSPPAAQYQVVEISHYTTQENGKTVEHTSKGTRAVPIPVSSSRINVGLHLDYRQKGLLWYSTYVVDFAGDYSFRNDSDSPQKVTFCLKFPAEKAVYDGLKMAVNGQPLAVSTDSSGVQGNAVLGAGETGALHVAYRSNGLNDWSYKLGDGVAQIRDFVLTMHTDFREIDFADDTLSPTAERLSPNGWELSWHYSDLVSGFQIGMTMPEKLQPGPLAGDISFFAPVSLFFFFFLMYVITTLRNIDLHPINYFFLATAFFAFHLLLAYLVDHMSIHAAMAISSVVSIFLVVSYLRLVVGMRFAAVEAGGAQLVYLVMFSYAFFWKGFTGLSITIICIITLFLVMQATGRIRWSERLAKRTLPVPAPQPQ